MKKLLVALVAIGVLSLVASSPASAQEAAIVKVPFKFIVGDRLMPAGSYRIASEAPGWSVVSITNINGKDKAFASFIATEGVPSKAMMSDAQVQFMTYHGQYFLKEVIVPGRDGRRLIVSTAQADRVLAKLNLSGPEPANAK